MSQRKLDLEQQNLQEVAYENEYSQYQQQILQIIINLFNKAHSVFLAFSNFTSFLGTSFIIYNRSSGHIDTKEYSK